MHFDNRDYNKIIEDLQGINKTSQRTIEERLGLAEKFKKEALNEMYFENPNLISQEDYNKEQLAQVKVSSHSLDEVLEQTHSAEKETERFEIKKDILSYQTYYQAVLTKPTSNWNRLEITFSDSDINKLEKLSISDIMHLFNDSVSTKEIKTEEKLATIQAPIGALIVPKEKQIEWAEKVLEKQEQSTKGHSTRLKANTPMEGKKENNGKLYYELSWEFIEEMAKRMANNKSDKYPLYNWKKNIDIEELKQAINRHHIEVMKGNYKDGNEVLGHIVSYACNAMMLWEQLNKK